WPFMVAANVGIFEPNEPNIVPDVFISLGVQVTPEWQNKKNRSYLISEFGKAPEIAVEIISNKKGNENRNKMAQYARMGVLYYVMFDPLYQLSNEILRMYQLDSRSGMYQALNRAWFPKLGLGLTLWEGEFEGTHAMWLRWCNSQGELILTGAERAEREQQRAEQERQRAEREQQRAEREQQRAEQEQQRAEQEQRDKEIALRQAEQEQHDKEMAQRQAEQERQRAEQERQDKEIAQRQTEQERQASNERILTVARNLLASMDDEAISQATGLEVMTIQQLRIAN
ncbi:Uma2 family endonuclease, partial [Anaerolineales bacterium HSG24]|nr:Uma2 family endonuclease [Anaerolineales bacterium HSG24]